jgi:hypothetical protein
MALVAVKEQGPLAHQLQRLHSAHPQQDLLLEPVLGVAPVEPVGDLGQPPRVTHTGAVEQQEREPADLLAPDPGQERPLPQLQFNRLLGGHHQPAARGVHFPVAVLLPAISIQPLVRVAQVVEEPDPNQRQALVGTDSQIVPGQHPQPPRVLGDLLADCELRREIGDPGHRAGEQGFGEGRSLLHPEPVDGAHADKVATSSLAVPIHFGPAPRPRGGATQRSAKIGR